MKIQKKEEEEVKKVEGYVDYERNVFVVTNDNGLLTKELPPQPRLDSDYTDIHELLKKYKPSFIK